MLNLSLSKITHWMWSKKQGNKECGGGRGVGQNLKKKGGGRGGVGGGGKQYRSGLNKIGGLGTPLPTMDLTVKD